jgi:hypothetical protein
MSLAGNLRTMPLPDILQWLASGQKTGTLHVRRNSVETRMTFREGRIYSSWSNHPRLSLGQFLIRARYVNEEQLFRALLRQEEEGRLLGSILVALGILSEEDLQQSLQAKAQETIYDLFLWPEGQFEFKDGELPEAMIHTEMDVQKVLLEGIRRVDEWARIRRVFPTTRTTFKVKGAPQVEDPVERQALGLAASGKSLAEIGLEMRRSDFETAALFFELVARDILLVDQVEADGSGSDTVSLIKDHLAHAYQLLHEKRYDEALRAYEQVLSLDRLNQNAKKGLLAVSEARDRDRALRSVPLEKVPVLTMDMVTLTKERFDPQEGFVLSRVNGLWDVQSILKLCPMAEEDALIIFARLLERKVIELR